MSIPIIILGDSGTGKSTALRNFKKDQCAVVNVLGKPLPFKSDIKTVSIPLFESKFKQQTGGKALKIDLIRNYLFNDANKEKAVVIDDFGYCITDMFMRWTTGDERMKDQFDVYKQIAGKVWALFNDVMTDGNVERIVYFVMHTDTDNMGKVVPLTVGKLLNEKVNLLGICTCVFLSTVSGDEYKFVTNGGNPAKSPLGMFADREIDNDLANVDATIRAFYGMDKNGGAK